MRLQDPKSREDVDGRPDGYVDVDGDLVEVDDSGEFEHDTITEAWAAEYAEREGVDVSVVLVGESSQGATETCETVKADGEVCGRELPCPYHSD